MYYSTKYQVIGEMANSGINKAQVLKAYETLLARGENPSLDSIRIALGNTGSKSTIHRYVKEIEAEITSRNDRRGMLSDAVMDLASRLATQLKEDADLAIEEAQNTFSEKEQELKRLLEEQKLKLTRLGSALEALSSENERKTIDLESLSADLGSVKQQLSIANQREEDQVRLLEEKDKAIASLEQKHQHNREAMEHYRQSVKEQREQDQRRHEQLLHDEKTEVRALQQTLSLKQHELTELARANAELSATVTVLRKELTQVQLTAGEREHRLNELNARIAEYTQKLVSMEKENGRLLVKCETSEESRLALEKGSRQIQLDLERHLAEVRGQLAAKNEIIQTLTRTDYNASK
jgi:chromosome segregation ATPase